MRRLRRTLSAIFILITAVIVAGIAILKSLDFNDYRDVVEREVEAAAGRNLSLDGRLDLQISLQPTLTVEGATFANAAWGTRPTMATLGHLEIEVELLPLFFREIEVNRLILSKLDLLLETDAAGVANWEVTSTDSEDGQDEDDAGGVFLPTVKNVLIEDARIVYRDGRADKSTTLELDRLELKSDDAIHPIRFRMGGRFAGDPFAASGEVGSLESLTTGQGPLPVSFESDVLGALVRVKGKIEDIKRAEGLDLELSARIDDWSRIRRALPDPSVLPVLPPMGLSGRLQGGAEAYRLTGLALRAGESDLAGRFTLDVGSRRPRIDADLTSDLIDLEPFLPPLNDQSQATAASEPPSLEALRSVDAKVALRVKRIETGEQTVEDLQVDVLLEDGRLSLNNFSAKTGRSDIAGRLSVIAGEARPQLDVDIHSERLDLTPFLATASDAKTAAGPVTSVPNTLDLAPLNLLDADVAFTAKRIEAGGDPFEEVTVKAKLKEGHLDVSSLAAKVAGNDLAGRFSLSPGEARPRVEATLTAKRLELAPYLGSDSAANSSAEKPVGNRKSGKVISAETFDFSALHLLDADLSIETERLGTGGLPIDNLAVKAILKDGRLTIAPLSFRVAGGEVSARASVTAVPGSVSSLEVHMTTEGVNMGVLLTALDITDSIEGAILQSKIDLTGQGESPKDIFATLNGEGLMTFGEARIQNSAVKWAGLDITQRAFNALNPFAKEKTHTPLRCAVIHFAAKDGKVWADQGIGAQTDRINVLGSGNIDLSTEKIEFAVKPEARKELGISLGSLASLMRVQGTLADPKVGFDKLGALENAVSVGAAVATYGLSIFAERLFKKVAGNGGPPCEVARDSALIPKAIEATGDSGSDASSGQEKKQRGGIGGAIQNFGKGLGGFLGGSKEKN